MPKHNLAIYGGKKLFKKDMVYDWPLITPAAEKIVVKQMHSSLSIYNKSGIIAEFEDMFAAIHERKYGLLTSSGTAALHSAFYALGIGPNDEVICPDYTFFATAMPLFQLGALPVLADCDRHGSLEPSEIEKLITKKTKAVAVTHMWGHPCDMSKIAAICKKNNLFLVEDCSHAHGARYNNKSVGTFGDIGIWSLQGQKIIAAGEGGILLTNNRELYDKAQLLGHFNKRAIQELDKAASYFQYAVTGTGLKYRSHPLGIAFAFTQLPHLKEWIKIKQINAKRIENIICSCPGITPLYPHSTKIINSYYAFVFLIDEDMAGFSREDLVKAVNAEGFLDLDIPKSTAPLHGFTIFQKPISPVVKYKDACIRKQFPNADFIYEHAVKVSVPVESKKGSRGDKFINDLETVWNKVIDGLNSKN